ncbi:MAG TPA: Rv3235 family protein [Marmoricola sp.]
MTAAAATTAPEAPAGGIARLHRLQAPEPAAIVPVAPLQGVLDLELGPVVTPDLPGRPGLRVVTGEERELDTFSARFAQAVVEVIGGDRGVHQLMRWTTERVYADLVHRSHALHQAAPADRRRRRVRATVRSVHLSRPHEDAAEISIHVRHGQRSRAIAARIERIEGRWRCSVLQFG